MPKPCTKEEFHELLGALLTVVPELLCDREQLSPGMRELCAPHLEPRLLAKLVSQDLGITMQQVVELKGLLPELDVGQLVAARPELLLEDTQLVEQHLQRLESLVCAKYSRNVSGGSSTGVSDSNGSVSTGRESEAAQRECVTRFLARHPQFILHDNVVAGLKALQWLSKVEVEAGKDVQAIVRQDPWKLVQGYHERQSLPVRYMSWDQDPLEEWWK